MGFWALTTAKKQQLRDRSGDCYTGSSVRLVPTRSSSELTEMELLQPVSLALPMPLSGLLGSQGHEHERLVGPALSAPRQTWPLPA